MHASVVGRCAASFSMSGGRFRVPLKLSSPRRSVSPSASARRARPPGRWRGRARRYAGSEGAAGAPGPAGRYAVGMEWAEAMDAPLDASDAELARRATLGERAAEDALCRRHRPRIRM